MKYDPGNLQTLVRRNLDNIPHKKTPARTSKKTLVLAV